MRTHWMHKHLIRLHIYRDAATVATVTEVMVDGTQPLVQSWRDLARTFAHVSCRLEKELHERHGLGMSEFEILDRLVEQTKQSVRMQELGDAVHLSQSALSRAVARLERDGLVSRGLCASDRRGVSVCVTDAGRERWDAARSTHRAVLAEML
jgi:DNA-binding MarR family transcriptional regulator